MDFQYFFIDLHGFFYDIGVDFYEFTCWDFWDTFSWIYLHLRGFLWIYMRELRIYVNQHGFTRLFHLRGFNGFTWIYLHGLHFYMDFCRFT